jgi:hypothetical protein
MWSSHIPNIDLSLVKFPALHGRENDDDDNGDGQPGEGGAGAGEQKSEADKAKDAGDDDDADLGDPQKKITAQQEIIARKQRQLEEVGPELEELRKFKKAAEEAKLSDEEKTNRRIKELEESDTKKSAALQKLVVKNAFLSSNDVAWHDPATALSLLDTSGFEIVSDEDGVPSVKDEKAFAAAIAKLAKDKPFLVKTSNSEEDDKDGGPKEWKGGKTGSTPAPKKSKEATDRERLLKKFPALRGRA